METLLLQGVGCEGMPLTSTYLDMRLTIIVTANNARLLQVMELVFCGHRRRAAALPAACLWRPVPGPGRAVLPVCSLPEALQKSNLMRCSSAMQLTNSLATIASILRVQNPSSASAPYMNKGLVLLHRPSDPWLAGADLVLQSEYKEQRDIVNSIMASVPGHPFWKLIIGRMLSVRAPLSCCSASLRAEGTSLQYLSV